MIVCSLEALLLLARTREWAVVMSARAGGQFTRGVIQPGAWASGAVVAGGQARVQGVAQRDLEVAQVGAPTGLR